MTVPDFATTIIPVTGAGYELPQTPTVSLSAYEAGDAVGGKLEFKLAGRVAGDPGPLVDIILIDDAGQDEEFELWLFNDAFTAEGDADAWTPSQADLRKLIGVISTADQNWLAAGTPSVCSFMAIRQYKLVGTSIYGQMVTRGTPDFVATDDLTVIIKGWQG